MTHVTISSGTAITAADIAMFDASWMQPDQRSEAFQRAYGNLYERSAVIAWEVGDRMAAMARMYELTRDVRYLSHLREFIDGIDGAVLKFRDDNHPGDIHGGGILAQPLDEFRGRVMPAWGGKTGGLHSVDEVVSSVYAYPIAAFARIVAEDPALHTAYGNDAVNYTNAVLQTVWAFMPQIGYRDAGNFVEAYLTHLAIHEFKPTEKDCEDAYKQALIDDPENEDNEQRRRNCNNLRKVFSRPMSHNENLAFTMVLIELWRTLESAFYRESPARSHEAEPTRALIPLLVSRQQRYFVNHLRTIEDIPNRPRFLWNHADDLPASVGSHTEDTSHGALDMRYLDLLRRNFDRLNVLPASVGEPIPLDRTHLQRFANTFLQKIVTATNFGTGTNFASNVEGDDPQPVKNELADGWMNLAVADVNVYQVCHNILLRTVNRSQPYLSIGSHSALLMNKRFAGRYQYLERTQPFGAPKAAGTPSGIVFPALGVANVVYRDAEGRLHELWQKGSEFGTSNLTQLADNAIRAAGDPRSFIATTDGLLVALYRGADRHVHSLYWSSGAVGRDALSGAAGAPPAAGNPVGFVQKDGTNVVIYRSGDKHLRSLWWTGTNRPGTEDLTAPSGAAPAGGDPAPYINTNTGENIVIYRGTDGHVHSMYWTTGAVGHDNLSGFAGSPRAEGDPVAYYTRHNDSHQVTYRSHDGHLHELWWVGNNPVNRWDLTAAAANAPPAASDPAAYYSAGTNTKHVIYRSANGHLNEIWWVPGGGIPAHLDITLLALAPSAADKPTAFTVEGPNSHHVVYRGTDGQIHEIRWS
ncbi:MAG: hypothetical protein AABO58_20040 [Acidobacteriota bacterium]